MALVLAMIRGPNEARPHEPRGVSLVKRLRPSWFKTVLGLVLFSTIGISAWWKGISLLSAGDPLSLRGGRIVSPFELVALAILFLAAAFILAREARQLKKTLNKDRMHRSEKLYHALLVPIVLVCSAGSLVSAYGQETAIERVERE